MAAKGRQIFSAGETANARAFGKTRFSRESAGGTIISLDFWETTPKTMQIDFIRWLVTLLVYIVCNCNSIL